MIFYSEARYMFNFLSMADSYESRKVARDEFDIKGVEIHVSTAEVTDSDDPYETCVFFDDKSKVVEMYDDRTSAEEGHERWVSFIKSNEITSLDNFSDQGTNIFNLLVKALES
jgi:hypothetical protein